MNKKIVVALIYAFALWTFIFLFQKEKFWLAMGLGTASLIIVSLLLGTRIDWSFKRANFRSLVLGLGSALLLYGIFYIGNFLLGFLGFSHTKWILNVYQTSEQMASWQIGLLLFFPIGFAEEFFWRKTIQSALSTSFGAWQGLLFTTSLYVLIHVPTLNPILLVASAVCGLFWGFLYMRTGSFLLVAISHMIWDPLIFVIRPIL